MVGSCDIDLQMFLVGESQSATLPVCQIMPLDYLPHKYTPCTESCALNRQYPQLNLKDPPS